MTFAAELLARQSVAELVKYFCCGKGDSHP